MRMVLGEEVRSLLVRLYPNSGYRSSIRKSSAWEEAPRLVFSGNDAWVSTLSENDTRATWNENSTAVSARTEGETAELWVGDYCIAAGKVTKRVNNSG